MPDLIVTRHAMDRYRECVADVSDSEIHRRLSVRVFEIAAEFGAPFVRLGGGQRAVIRDGAVVTVIPSEYAPGRLDPLRDPGATDG